MDFANYDSKLYYSNFPLIFSTFLRTNLAKLASRLILSSPKFKARNVLPPALVI